MMDHVPDNRPPVYMEGDVLVIRASAIGHPCLWELIAAGQGNLPMSIPSNLQRAYDEGNLLEPVILKRLEKEYGMKFVSKQKEGHLWLSEDVVVRYHPDALGQIDEVPEVLFGSSVPTHRPLIIECKALADSVYQQAKRTSVGKFFNYDWQASVMMEGEGLPLVWAALNKGKPPDAEGNREPCEDAGKILIEPVHAPPVSRTAIELKASLIKEGVFGEDILTSDRQCDDMDHWPCLYLHLRPQADDSGTARAVYIPSNKDEVDFLIREFLTHKGREAESRQRKDAARKKLVEMAGDAGYIQTDKFYVPIVDGTSVSTDTSSMSPELLKTIEKYKVRRKYRYIRGVKRLEL